MTSHDPKMSKSWPQNLWSSVSQQACEIHERFILTTNRKPHIASSMVTWRHVTWPQNVKDTWLQYLWNLISQKPCETDGWFKLSTNTKSHIRSLIPNTHRHRRRNSTRQLSCVGVGGACVLGLMVTWAMLWQLKAGEFVRNQQRLGCKILANEG